MKKIVTWLLTASIVLGCSKLEIVRVDASIASVSPDAAVPGSTIVISGSNFTENTVVTFGTQKAEIVGVTGDRLEVLAPNPLEEGDLELNVSSRGVPAITNFEVLPFFVEKTPHPDGAINGTGFVLNGEIYFGTGRIGNGNITSTFYKYSAGSDTWTELVSNNTIPARAGAFGFEAGGKGYVLGGSSGTDFWEYDPVTNNWTQKKDYPNSSLLFPVILTLGSDVYLCTGFQNFISREVWRYSITNDDWMQMNDFGGVKRGAAVGFVIDDVGYAGQGYDFDTNTRLNDFWSYNQSSDSWDQVGAPVPSANMEGGIGFSLNGNGYIGLGRNGNTGIKDFWKYNPSQDNWDLLTEFVGSATLAAQVFVVGKRAYIINGSSFNNSEDFVELWEFTPETF
ncbi:hypothetical protein FNH22_29370 [Fulvivirga sp. M361]|uniref:IPT/TIG domain-containing protein n=1 Tax=Fulvivirga sp. M361 TaxID=2594266 RepID=UPI0011798BAD|nr:IPT/TIG domain-containing protein [Fulvivirga sp. M361]TRX48286.1 hypothetical protein FNH22_29370 [Fulvivirga sp. M361]